MSGGKSVMMATQKPPSAARATPSGAPGRLPANGSVRPAWGPFSQWLVKIFRCVLCVCGDFAEFIETGLFF
jgi:hypothetical protein